MLKHSGRKGVPADYPATVGSLIARKKKSKGKVVMT